MHGERKACRMGRRSDIRRRREGIGGEVRGEGREGRKTAEGPGERGGRRGKKRLKAGVRRVSRLETNERQAGQGREA